MAEGLARSNDGTIFAQGGVEDPIDQCLWQGLPGNVLSINACTMCMLASKFLVLLFQRKSNYLSPGRVWMTYLIQSTTNSSMRGIKEYCEY